MHEIDLSRARVGDSVRRVLNGWGEVKMIRTGLDYPIEIEYPYQIGYPNWKNYAYNGRQLQSDLYPEIVEWQPQKRKVKKEITVYVNVIGENYYMFRTQEDAINAIGRGDIGFTEVALPCTGYYEVDE